MSWHQLKARLTRSWPFLSHELLFWFLETATLTSPCACQLFLLLLLPPRPGSLQTRNVDRCALIFTGELYYFFLISCLIFLESWKCKFAEKPRKEVLPDAELRVRSHGRCSHLSFARLPTCPQDLTETGFYTQHLFSSHLSQTSSPSVPFGLHSLRCLASKTWHHLIQPLLHLFSGLP